MQGETSNAAKRTRNLIPFKIAAGVAGLTLSAALITASLAQTQAPAEASGPTSLRRLSEVQYRRSIEDIFGADVTVPGRFEPAVRDQGLLAIGDSRVSVSASGFEQYEMRAGEIAAQVLTPERRGATVPCTPRSPTAFDEACATTFFAHYGRALYRRPLSAAEMTGTMTLARNAARSNRDFYKGLEDGLSRLLASPNFIFRVETSESDPNRPGMQRLDAYSLATRLSFLLWNAPPDAELSETANRGTLHDPAELGRQVDRMIASPRFADGVRAFFSDMLGYDQFNGLTKDQEIYPQYTSQLAADAREQTLRTIVDLLVTNNGDYRDLFTTRTTFLNRNLAALYRLPLRDAGDENGWSRYTFDESQPRAGVLTLAAFLMLDPTHEGRSSPTIRGKTVRELFLCQRVPDPPGNVDFSAVQNTGDVVHRTARERLTVHQNAPACAACHRLTDPIGLALENYDAIGGFRTHENGALIDTSGTFDNGAYQNAIELQRLIRESPTAPNCVVRRSYEYGVGRPATASEGAWIRAAGASFAQDQYSFPALMRRIATSSAFRSVTNVQTASN